MALLLKNLLFTVVVPGTVAVYVPWSIADDHALASGLWLAAGGVLMASGVAIYAWCVWDFASFGRGTPAPTGAPVKLVVRGLYRYSRNPMYVGVLCVIASWALLFRAPEVLLYAVVVATGFTLFVRFYEEPHLRKVFGAEYEEFCRRVPRWVGRARLR